MNNIVSKKRLRKRIKKHIKSPIKKALKRYSKTHPAFKELYRKALHNKRVLYYKLRSRGITPDAKTVVFESFKGKNWGCSVKAVYEYMIRREEFADWNFIIAFNNPKAHKYLEENPNTKVVKKNTKTHEKAMARAKYWISNYRVPDHIWPREDQVFVQCWHGTPLKRLGYDIETQGNAAESQDDVRAFYDIDAQKFKYILSPSSFTTKVFTSAWNLKATGQEHKVMEIGYPRNDFLVNHTDDDVASIKEALGIPEGKKVILYASTWRDNQHVAGVGFTYDLKVDFAKWREELGDDYVVLFRAHYLVASKFSFEDYEGFVYNVSSYDDINHLYVIADLLITDYSSVFFDYSILRRPILFYMYDLDDYKDNIRGFYFGLDVLPGEIITEEDELIGAIPTSISDFVYDAKYAEFNQTFGNLEDGHAAERFVNKVFSSN